MRHHATSSSQSPPTITVHRIQQAIRSASRSKLRWVSIRQPHTATGRISMIGAEPENLHQEIGADRAGIADDVANRRAMSRG